MNKKIVKDAMILTAFTLVLGLILGVVNEITKGPIAKVNYEAEQECLPECIKDADPLKNIRILMQKKQRISSLRAIMPMMRSYL